jgi:23S rRNA (adenine2503-C2)-methyltransferase
MVESPARKSIYDYSLKAIADIFSAWGEPNYRAHQVWEGLYKHLWNNLDQFTMLPLSLREKLSTVFMYQSIHPGLSLLSKDKGTQKYLFRLSDNSIVETVLMRYRKRNTLCISTQAGCAMGCIFCATGQMGFRRNLSSGEIVEQVLFFARRLSRDNEKVTNVVMMGMGEPFHNYDATMDAIDRLNHPAGFNLGARKFTISTVGLVPAIRRFTEERRQINLAVSLHAVDDDLRSSLLPVNKKYPLDELIDACIEYVNKTNRRITFEWALINNVNDTVDQAELLAQRLGVFQRHGVNLCHVNVIPLNPTHNYAGDAATKQRVAAFKQVLDDRGIPCTVRVRRGIDIQAGCGQLAGEMNQ